MTPNRMHSDSGYIKLYRRITEWRWYSDPVMFRVFVHLLLTVNYEDAEWRDMIIKRGQRVTSVQHLAEEVGMGREAMRYALKRLEDSGEITSRATSLFTVITLNNYNLYQGNSQPITNEQQTNNKPITNEPGTIKEEKEEKEEKEGEESTYGRPENAFSGNSVSQKPKDERRQPNADSRYSSEREQELQKALTERYGRETVELYAQRFQQWSMKKGAAVPMYQTIEKWIGRDGVKPLCERGSDTHSSLDTDKLERQMLEFYM